MSTSCDALARRTAAVKRAARDVGFCDVGIATPETLATAFPDSASNLDAFLAAGAHGTMSWLADTAARRHTPRALWPEVKSIIVIAMNYGANECPSALLEAREYGTISVHARGDDYHRLFKKMLKRLAGQILALIRNQGGSDGSEAEVKIFVDTAPVLEKPLAAAAGLGWQGKHSNLVSRRFGSWLFLGEIFTTLELVPDRPHKGHCGSCRACINACPTGAIIAPYRLDARRCIAYLTIEHRGMIPEAFRAAIGNRIYGCDDCLEVCPWNRFAQVAKHHFPARRVELSAPHLADLATIEADEFRVIFAGTGIRRLGWERFMRNVLIAIGNSRSSDLIPCAEARLDAESEVIRGTAIWALKSLCHPARFASLRQSRVKAEQSLQVLHEWGNDQD